MTAFQIGVNRKSGAVTIWIETAFGLKPILVCADLEGVREFGGMLLNFYNRRKEEMDTIKMVSDNLLKQAMDEDEYFTKEGL